MANSFGRRHAVGHPQTDRQIDGANPNQIAVGERFLPVDQRAPDERAVGAAQVLEHRAAVAAVDANDCVAARNAGRVEPEVTSRIASDDVVALRELPGPVFPHHPTKGDLDRGAAPPARPWRRKRIQPRGPFE